MKKHALLIGIVLGLAQIAFPAFAKGPTVRQAQKLIAAEATSYDSTFYAKHAKLEYLTSKMHLATALKKGPVGWNIRSGKNAEGYLGLDGTLTLKNNKLVVTLDRGDNGKVIESHYVNHR